MRLIAVALYALLYALLLLAIPVQAASPSSAVTQDRPADPDHPAVNRQVLVPSAGEGMNALLFLASGPGPKPTVVLLHGLPGNEKNLDLAQAIRRAGWNVLTFNYRGSWGSPGTFSLAGGVEDGAAAMRFVQQPDVAARYSIDPRRVVIAGHSFGGYVAARHAATHPDIAGLILLDAWNPGADARQLRAGPDRHAEYAAAIDDLGNSLQGADAQSLTAEVANLGDDDDLMTIAPQLARHPLLTVWADRGDAAANAALANAIAVQQQGRIGTAHLPTDHGFNDHRIALATLVVNWLGELAASFK